MFKIAVSAVVFCGLVAVIYAQAMTYSCLVCGSHSSPRCIDTPDPSHFSQTCLEPVNGSCFNMVLPAGQIERGCLSQLDNETRTACHQNSVGTCSICMGTNINPNDCNTGLFPNPRQFCHICTGNVNSTCGNNVTTSAEVCSIFSPNDRCFTARHGDQYERGCVSSTQRCGDNENCLICAGHGCNNLEWNSASTKAISVSLVLLSAITVAFMN